LSALQLKHLTLVDVPNLTAKCISQYRVDESLTVSSSVLLNHMLMAEGFRVPPYLCLYNCKELSVLFEEPTKLSSVKRLNFCVCEMESLPRNLKSLTSMESLDITFCQNITSLPNLPSSLQRIRIWGCPVLKNNCQEADGESWPKISHIRWKDFIEVASLEFPLESNEKVKIPLIHSRVLIYFLFQYLTYLTLQTATSRSPYHGRRGLCSRL
jgi:hypothetical protein